jgi:hypothetical protein
MGVVAWMYGVLLGKLRVRILIPGDAAIHTLRLPIARLQQHGIENSLFQYEIILKGECNSTIK